MARLDRLGSAKELAQTGACIGRAFHHRLIAAVLGETARIAEALQRLEDSELVFREGTPPEAIYTFKHALIQNTAHDSLLKTRRQKIHAAVASKLEADFPQIVPPNPRPWPHHKRRGSRNGCPLLVESRPVALRRSANLEAIAHLRRALDSSRRCRIRRSGLGFKRLQSALGVAMMGAKGLERPKCLRPCRPRAY